MLVGGRVGEREALDLVRARLTARLAYDKRNRFGSLDVVVERHDGRLRDIRMALEHALDIGRINILAAGHEHVVGAPEEIVKAVRIAPKHVAADIETIGRDRRGYFGAIVIAKHQRRRLYFEHAAVGIAVAAVDQPY